MGAGRAMITEIEDYFAKGCGRCDRFATADCSTRHWAEGLAGLRDICRGAGLEETVKWGHPCYVHAGRNVAIIGAFRGDFRLTFFQAGLMKDPEGVLERQGPNTAHADMIRFTDAAQPAAMAGTIRAYLAEAMGYAERGIRAPKSGCGARSAGGDDRGARRRRDACRGLRGADAGAAEELCDRAVVGEET
jgi:uncharacterized protein YdeI (YjbR/CyaY-like superfamily)